MNFMIQLSKFLPFFRFSGKEKGDETFSVSHLILFIALRAQAAAALERDGFARDIGRVV